MSLTKKYTRPPLTGNRLGTDVSRQISTRMGRGTMNMGFHRVIDQYNKEHPDNKIDYQSSGIEEVFETIEDWDGEERWHAKKEQWDEWIQQPENKPIKDILDKMKVEVDTYNQLMTYKYNTAESFFRGTNFYELEGYEIDKEIGAYSDDSFDFVALTMNPQQAKSTFNQGVVVEYDADHIRKSDLTTKVEYTMDNVPILAIDHDSGVSDLEQHDTKQNALFVDEQEIRVEKYMEITPETVKSIRIYPEKLGYDLLIKQLENEELENSFKYKGGQTPRVWMLINKSKVIDVLQEKFNFTDNINIDFEHRFPS